MTDALSALFLLTCLHRSSLRPHYPNTGGVGFDKRTSAPKLGETIEPTDLSSFTVVALKEKLRSAGLKVSGKKVELIARLQQHAQSDERSKSHGASTTFGGERVRASRQQGTISSYSMVKQYGFITPEDGSEELMFYSVGVHREKDIDSFLYAGDPVEYSIRKDPDGRDLADQVTGPGGEPVRSRPRHRGTISSYSMMNGYGFITPEDGSPSLFFHSFGVNGEKDVDLILCAGDPVEYGVGKGPDGRDVADQVTGPGGELVQLRSRQRGTISSYSIINGYGFITPENGNGSLSLFFHRFNVHREKDSYLILCTGDPVEYSVGKGPDGRDLADQVTSPGGDVVRSRPRHQGTILTYSMTNRSGFITPEDRWSPSLFFSRFSVHREKDIKFILCTGDQVEYSLGKNTQGGDIADQITARGGELLRSRPRQRGTISSYSKVKQYGFITPEDGSEELMFYSLGVHREKDIDSFLCAGDPVEYSVGKLPDGRDLADQVTGPGGEPVRSRPRKRGTISSYSAVNGYGFVAPEDGSPSLFFRSFGVHGEKGIASILCPGDPVEYSVGRGPDGRDLADQVTGPGGELVRSRPRQRGTILSFKMINGYGFITPEDGSPSLFFHSFGVHREKDVDLILCPGDQVEYSLGKNPDGRDVAYQVTAPGGGLVRSRPRQRGTIKTYRNGYGFISPEDGSKYIKFSRLDVHSGGDIDSSLRIGEAVEYSLGADPRGREAAVFVSFP